MNHGEYGEHGEHGGFVHLVNKGIDKSPVRCDVNPFANINSMPNNFRRSQEELKLTNFEILVTG